jgi:hypothetical protein
MSVAGRTRRGPTVTSYHVQLSDDGQEFTVIADAAQRRSASREEHHHREPARRRPRRACGSSGRAQQVVESCGSGIVKPSPPRIRDRTPDDQAPVVPRVCQDG